jgi:hypothetical protein
LFEVWEVAHGAMRDVGIVVEVVKDFLWIDLPDLPSFGQDHERISDQHDVRE